jgi:hypothetical protein
MVYVLLYRLDFVCVVIVLLCLFFVCCTIVTCFHIQLCYDRFLDLRNVYMYVFMFTIEISVKKNAYYLLEHRLMTIRQWHFFLIK